MEWIPIVFVVFKVLVLGTGMFFAVKWHYDRGNKGRDRQGEKRAVLRAGSKAVGVFVLALLALAVLTYYIVRSVGLSLTM